MRHNEVISVCAQNHILIPNATAPRWQTRSFVKFTINADVRIGCAMDVQNRMATCGYTEEGECSHGLNLRKMREIGSQARCSANAEDEDEDEDDGERRRYSLPHSLNVKPSDERRWHARLLAFEFMHVASLILLPPLPLNLVRYCSFLPCGFHRCVQGASLCNFERRISGFEDTKLAWASGDGRINHLVFCTGGGAVLTSFSKEAYSDILY